MHVGLDLGLVFFVRLFRFSILCV